MSDTNQPITEDTDYEERLEAAEKSILLHRKELAKQEELLIRVESTAEKISRVSEKQEIIEKYFLYLMQELNTLKEYKCASELNKKIESTIAKLEAQAEGESKSEKNGAEGNDDEGSGDAKK